MSAISSIRQRIGELAKPLRPKQSGANPSPQSNQSPLPSPSPQPKPKDRLRYSNFRQLPDAKTAQICNFLQSYPDTDNATLAATFGLSDELAFKVRDFCVDFLYENNINDASVRDRIRVAGIPKPVTKETLEKGPEKKGTTEFVSHSPEEVLRRLEERRSNVTFDMTPNVKAMYFYTQWIMWIAVVLYASGTIGEILILLMDRQKDKSLYTIFSIFAASFIAEAILIAVSFSIKLLRYKADKHPAGWTPKEKAKLKQLKPVWVFLAGCIAATTIAFIVMQTNAGDIGIVAVWAIAIIRSMAALTADYYAAFVSEEKPTTGDVALAVQEQEGVFEKKLLEQEQQRVSMLNDGIQGVKRITAQAVMEGEAQEHDLRMHRLNQEAEFELKQAQNEMLLAGMRMQTFYARVLTDPDMPEQERQMGFEMIRAIASARSLPAKVEVSEEPETGEL